jgi:hypothetical protein
MPTTASESAFRTEVFDVSSVDAERALVIG